MRGHTGGSERGKIHIYIYVCLSETLRSKSKEDTGGEKGKEEGTVATLATARHGVAELDIGPREPRPREGLPPPPLVHVRDQRLAEQVRAAVRGVLVDLPGDAWAAGGRGNEINENLFMRICRDFMELGISGLRVHVSEHVEE